MTKTQIKTLQSKEKKLSEVAIELKKAFVGLDSTIDELIKDIRIWFLMPELLTRPVIINLWGLTGVGKTDLIRKMVKLLDFGDKFMELELTNSDKQYRYSSSVSAILEENGYIADEQSIILFDEIQKFRTISPNGEEVQNVGFADFWELLSDGKLSRRVRSELDGVLFDLYYYQKSAKDSKEPNADVIDHWRASRIAKLLNTRISPSQISTLTNTEAIKMVEDQISTQKLFEQVDFSKTLIFICGNLDEAFTMSTQTAESDVDADIFRALTQKITVVDIKNSLTKRFRPEQVARFGNIHIIYPSLSQKNFEDLIAFRVGQIVTRVANKFGINIEVKANLNQLIYQNGVFPTQGVRPVLSTISDILETNLSYFLFEAIVNNLKDIVIDYNFTTKKIIAIYSESQKTVEIFCEGTLDKIRNKNQIHLSTNVAVHESGHALVYALLFNLAPIQLRSKVASSSMEGFTFSHSIHLTKQNILHKVKVLLAGGLSERIIFGEENQSTGWSQDLTVATEIIADYIRKFAFDDNISVIKTERENGSSSNTDLVDSNLLIEKILQQQLTETLELINKNKTILVELSKKLVVAGSLNSQEFADIILENKIKVNLESEKFTIVPSYGELL